jgi:hypothetical protein
MHSRIESPKIVEHRKEMAWRSSTVPLFEESPLLPRDIVKKLASKLHVHSVNYAAKLIHTRRALSSTIINSHPPGDSFRSSLQSSWSPFDFPFLFAVEELYGTRYQSGSFFLINVGSGFHCLRRYFFFISVLWLFSSFYDKKLTFDTRWTKLFPTAMFVFKTFAFREMPSIFVRSVTVLPLGSRRNVKRARKPKNQVREEEKQELSTGIRG